MSEPKFVNLALVRGRLKQSACKHLHIEVDETLYEVVCVDCGQRLNPVAVLAQFARKEIRLGRELENYKAAREFYEKTLAELKLRNRVKCMHCGRFTAINRRVPS